MPASFVVTSFDSSGKLIQETTPLNAADPLTYEAEKLFGIDLNDDDVQGRNVQEISKSELANSYGWTIFESEVEEGDSGEEDDNSEEIVTPDSINSKNDFTKTVEVTIPQYSEEGTWILDRIYTSDAVGNHLDIYRDYDGNYVTEGVDENGDYVEKLVDLDFKTEFEVISSNPDTTAPEFKNLSLIHI